MFLGLRKIDGVARSDFYQMFGIDIEAIYGPIITALRNQGFMEAKEGRLYLTDIGIDVSNQVLSKFLLDKQPNSIDKLTFIHYYIRVCVELSVSGYNVF